MVERSTSRRPKLANDGPGRAISLGLGLKGCAAEGTTLSRVLAEMGQITDAEGDGVVRQLLSAWSLHRPLDKTCSIDGDGGIRFLLSSPNRYRRMVTVDPPD